jgi:hypothetical protein
MQRPEEKLLAAHGMMNTTRQCSLTSFFFSAVTAARARPAAAAFIMRTVSDEDEAGPP